MIAGRYLSLSDPKEMAKHIFEESDPDFVKRIKLGDVLVAGGKTPDEAVTQAVRMVDDNFGFNPLLGSARQKFALRLLGNRGDLPRLVAWYGR